MLPYRCVSPQCAMPLCQSYTRFDACPVSCLRCMSPCSTLVLLLSLLSPGSRPVSAGSLCCKLVLALPDFKPTQASKQREGQHQSPQPPQQQQQQQPPQQPPQQQQQQQQREGAPSLRTLPPGHQAVQDAVLMPQATVAPNVRCGFFPLPPRHPITPEACQASTKQLQPTTGQTWQWVQGHPVPMLAAATGAATAAPPAAAAPQDLTAPQQPRTVCALCGSDRLAATSHQHATAAEELMCDAWQSRADSPAKKRQRRPQSSSEPGSE